MKKYAVGIDIGGTKVAIGIVDQQGEVVNQTVLPTDLSITAIEMLDKIIASTKQLITNLGISEENIAGIGIGAPGPIDTNAGKIVAPPNLPNWHGVELVEYVQASFPNTKIIFENDATAATMAEKWVGAAQESDHFIYLTISTGIGAGLYANKKLISGYTGNAGDVGHMVIDPNENLCSCGGRGCFESLVSGTAIARRASILLNKQLTTKDVFDLYQKQDNDIVPFIEKTFKYLGIATVNLINMFDPQKIVIGGGVSQVGEPLFNAVKQYVQKNALNPAGRNTEIVPAQLNRNVGVIGAASLILLDNNE